MNRRSRRSERSIRLRGGAAAAVAAVALGCLVAGGPATAGDAVAPAGACAESRRTAITPDPDPGYSVAGVPAGRFVAADVAALGGIPALAPPPSAAGPRFPGIGPCETRASGCTQTVPSSPPVSGSGDFPFVPPKP
ncbi:MAG: hypothetical protein ACQGVK_08240 [Myxococcota bacterium]